MLIDDSVEISNTEEMVIQYCSKAFNAVEWKCFSIAVGNVLKELQECKFKNPVFRNNTTQQIEKHHLSLETLKGQSANAANARANAAVMVG